MTVRMRHTRSHTSNRRSHQRLAAARAIKCENCGSPRMPHQVCGTCGTYKGRLVVDKAAHAAKKEKKAKERATA